MSWLADLIGIRTLLVDGSEQEKRSKLAITAGDGVELAAVDNPVADRIELTITMPAGAGDATSLRGIELDAESFALPEDGEVVTYDAGSGTFVLSAGGGGSGDATSLQAVPLDAATVGAPNDGDVIVYDSIAGEYKAASPGSLGLPSGTADDVLVYDGADWVADKLVNAHIDAAAAIAGTKIAPDFGAQPISTTGNLTVGASSSFVRSTADSTGSLASLRKDRAGAKLESGDTIGAWRFQPHDGSGYLITAQLTADVVGSTNANNIPSRVRLQVGDNTAGLRTVLEATATSTILRCGANVAGTGDIRMDRGAAIVALNQAETQNYDLIVLSADELTIGDATEGVGNVYQTNGDHTFRRGSTTMAVVGDRQLRVQVESSTALGWDFGVKSSYHDNESTGAHVVLEKSRGTAASPAGLSNGDQIGVVWFSPYNADDTAYDLTAGVRARVEGVPSAGSVPTKIELLAGETLSGLWTVFSGGPNAVAITVNDPSATLGFFLDATTHAAALAGQHYALGDQPASWQSSVGAAWIDGVTTPPSAVESDGAFLWSDASTSELRTHRAGVIDYLALRTATGLATTGHVRAGNALSIVARNNANGTDRKLLNWASDALSVGDGDYPVTVNASSAGFFVAIASGVRWTFNSTSITGGATSNVIGFTGTVAGQRIGGNNTSGTPQSLTVRAAGKVSISGSGADLLLQGGKFNTSGSGGAVRLQYNPDDTTPVDRIVVDSTGIGFFGATPIAKPSAGDIASLLTALENLGLITNTS